MIKKILFSIFLFSVTVTAFGQSPLIQKGDIHFEFFQFKEAIQDYEAALREGNSKLEAYLLEQLAQCYKYSFQYTKAEQYFSRLVRLGDGKPAPDVYLDYGAILKINGDYNRARDQYRYYLTIFPDDAYANFQLKSLSWAIRNQDSIRNFSVLPTDLNIGGLSLGYSYFEDGLIYAKARNAQADANTTQLFDLDYAEIKDSISFIPGDKIVEKIQFETNEGSPSISPDGLLLYFTATATKVKNGVVKKKVGAIEISSDGVSNLKIYVAKLVNGEFVSPQELPFNNKEYNCTHPSISEDGNTLYFASDMPKGYGGLDIYKAVRGQDGKWGAPENLGPSINTSEQEAYPFVRNGVLFFASKGLNGFGGYDLYQSKLTLGVPGAPLNMGKPFNSSKDDVAFICREDGRRGYFSSNRDNGDGIDKVYFFIDNRIFAEAKAAAAAAALAAANQKPVAAAAKPAEKPTSVYEQKPETEVITPVKQVKKPKNKPATAVASVNDEDLLKIVFEKVHFNFNDVAVPSASYITLDSAIRASRLSSRVKIEVTAHTDSRGSAEYNQKLSERRAAAVRTYLIKRGVASSRIITHGRGETQLLNQCADGIECTDEQHQENRRVDVKIVK